jgi:hypothetical protein
MFDLPRDCEARAGDSLSEMIEAEEDQLSYAPGPDSVESLVLSKCSRMERKDLVVEVPDWNRKLRFAKDIRKFGWSLYNRHLNSSPAIRECRHYENSKASMARHQLLAFALCTGLLGRSAPDPAGCAGICRRRRKPPSQDPNFNFLPSNLVNITATVLDERGTYIDGLKQEDFQISEDGVQQKISFFSHDRKIPVSVGVMVDISGSMRPQTAAGPADRARNIAGPVGAG